MKEITLAPVTDENREAVCQIMVREDQAKYVWDNRRTLDALEEWESPRTQTFPMAVYAGSEVVGFAMYTVSPAKKWCYIDRLMIGADMQGKGFGRQALILLINEMKQRFDVTEFEVGVDSDNVVAKQTYASQGFRFKDYFAGDAEAELWML